MSGAGSQGYVASSRNATLDIDPARTNVASLTARRVVAPVDAFLVVTASGEGTGPATQVGLVAVPRGESQNVVIPLMGVRTSAVDVTLFADKGTKGRLDAGGMGGGGPAPVDRAITVDGKPVSVTVTIGRPTAPMGQGAAVLDVFDQPASKAVNVTHVVTPGPSWIVVYAEKNGVPGAVIGRRSVGALDAIGVTVPVSSTPRGAFVALQVDGGAKGRLEYQRSGTASPGVGPDQPYVVGGAEVIKRIVLQ
jgi:hypothetical protein